MSLMKDTPLRAREFFQLVSEVFFYIMLGALDVHSFLAIVLHSIHSVLHSAEAIGCHFGVRINTLHPTA